MNINFSKGDGLVPAVIQDYTTMQVLMVGYMNEEAYLKTASEGRVTFFSRSRQRLWTKGESSGNFLNVKEIVPDCDEDALLIRVVPAGPVCHLGTYSCFGDMEAKGFLYRLEKIIKERIEEEAADSYTNTLYRKGINKIAQKVGEEAVELIIEAKDNNIDLFKNEAADLLYHLLVLLRAKSTDFSEIEAVLSGRHKSK
ncbi:bifunctional phosphoribosyl-AMP cyclohydrolase/phosphoribosyl-ATP diphosphatase HisIE [bacterium]|nr:bifunctional phosphoribosyl-AMP cyclohydrolase/phosphoribosyl-ATP diphosphatase HisIE [bacterium]